MTFPVHYDDPEPVEAFQFRGDRALWYMLAGLAFILLYVAFLSAGWEPASIVVLVVFIPTVGVAVFLHVRRHAYVGPEVPRHVGFSDDTEVLEGQLNELRGEPLLRPDRAQHLHDPEAGHFNGTVAVSLDPPTAWFSPSPHPRTPDVLPLEAEARAAADRPPPVVDEEHTKEWTAIKEAIQGDMDGELAHMTDVLERGAAR